MSVLYLLEPQSIIHKEGGRLVVKKGGDTLHSVHVFRLDQVVIMGPVTITPTVIRTLLLEGIDTVFMSRRGRYYGRLQGPEGKNIVLRRDQFGQFTNPDFVLSTAKAVVKGKLRNQRALLQRLMRNQKGLDLKKAVDSIGRLADLAESAADLDELRGYEGQAAAAYFPAWGRGLKVDGLSFNRRVRRPPKGPVNALLSLGYTLLLNNVLAAAHSTGLDPYLGALHSVDYGRPSLALDLMEEWRPLIIDTLVLSVFNLGVLTDRDFTTNPPKGEDDIRDEEIDGKEPGTYLIDAGWRKYIGQFERRMATEVTFHLNNQHLSYRDAIRQQVRHFASYVRGESNIYRPMPLR
jgi:CRISPR-associated protein Cas1